MTIVNASPDAVQLFALIAVILFTIAAFASGLAKNLGGVLLAGALGFLSLAVLFLT